MTKPEIIKSLNELVANGTRKSTIEGAVGLPVNSLASVLTGKKEMPNKWVEKFGGYFEKLEVKNAGGDVQTAVNTLLETGLIKPKSAAFGEGVFVPSKNMEWIGKVEAWCKGKGFPPSELIEKFEGLEAQLKETENLIPSPQSQVHQNKPDPAPQTGKSGKTTPKEEKGKEGAENGPKTLEEVKALCPKHLKGVDRAIWIAQNREKYGV